MIDSSFSDFFPKYKRVLLKLSGEALARNNSLFDEEKISNICNQIKILNSHGVQIAIVIGGGNIWRGKEAINKNKFISRFYADYIGMSATFINGIILSSKLESLGVKVKIKSVLPFHQISTIYSALETIFDLENNNVVILTGGTGSPLFTTDTASVLRAFEINADVILMAKNGIDGVYDKDPVKKKEAVKFSHLTFKELRDLKLKFMDLTAATILEEIKKPSVLVFNINEENNILKSISGKAKLTTISNE
jgi:uridylate kinase